MRLYSRHLNPGHLTFFHPATSGPQETDLTMPTVIFLPGVQTTDDARFNDQTALESLASKSGVVERHLGGAPAYAKGARFFTATYSHVSSYWSKDKGAWQPESDDAPRKTNLFGDGLGRSIDVQRWSQKPAAYYSKDAKRLTEALILPALHDEDGAWRPKKDICEKLSHLTLVGDSYGSIFAEQIANVLRDELTRKAGYKPEICDRILAHVVFLGASNIPQRDEIEPGRKCRNTFSGIYFEGRGDEMIGYTRKNLLNGLRDHGMTVLRMWRDSLEFTSITDPEALKALKQRMAAPYRPPAAEIADIAIKPVDRGARVEFNVPQHYQVLVENEQGVRARQYANKESHQTYSYIYPLPGRRDHADLFGRALRNAMNPKLRASPPRWEDLLSRSAPNPGALRAEAVAVEKHLDLLCLRQRSRLSAAKKTGATHVEALQERDDAARPLETARA